jgi:hypothetical protein
MSVKDSAGSAVTPYEWGKVINFGLRGNATSYCKSGWSDPEAGLIWTNGINSRLVMSIVPPTADITLVINCSPFTAKGVIEEQELHLYVNFLRVDFQTIAGEKTLELSIPKHVFSEPLCTIDLYIPSARSPAELGLNPDIRRLGLAISRLVLIQA